MHFTELIYLYFLRLRLTKAQSRIHWNSKWLHRYLQYAVINCEVYLSPAVGDNLADLEDRGSQTFVPRNRSWKEFSLTHTPGGTSESFPRPVLWILERGECGLCCSPCCRYISTLPLVLEVERVDGFSSVPQHRRAHTVQSTACKTSQGTDMPRLAMQRLSFPFIFISLLLSFSNANRLNRLFSFVLDFLHVTLPPPITLDSAVD